MAQFKQFVFNQFQENTFVIYDETGEAAIIDAGCFFETERNELRSFCSENHIKPVKLLNTHLHLDHIFGNRFVYNTYGLQPQAHKKDEHLIDDSYAIMFGIQLNEPFMPLGSYLNEGDRIQFGKTELEVIHIPGHSPGGVAFYCESQKWLFSGDILFNQSIGRSDLPGGNHKELIEGIKSKLLTLPDDVSVFPGHGPFTTIGDEKKMNPFLD